MSIDRRTFLKTVGGASLGAGLLGGGAAAENVTTGQAATAFGFADDRVPMNAANLCPMPTVVHQAVERYGRELDRDMSHVNRGRIEKLKEDARGRLAVQLGVSADELAIVRNTSEANNIVVQGMPLEAGDEILLWDQNHPSNGVAWDVQAARSGSTVRRLELPSDPSSADELANLFRSAVSPKTRVVSFTHISNVSGLRLPAQAICETLKSMRNDLYVHVDGAQTWGVADVNLERMGCDSFSASAHKWFMGPREVGILYVRQPHIERLWPNCVSVPWGNAAEPSVAGARKFEAFGQRDDAAIAALGDAIGFHESLTPAGIERRAAALGQRLRDSLQELGVPFVSPLSPEFTSNVVILAATPENATALVGKLLREAGIIVAAVGGLRMTPHVYNTDEHIDRVVDAIAKNRHLLRA
jgi:selenocysteine lyase/cysteine desulfurase